MEFLGLHYSIWFVLAIYFVGMLWMGWWSRRGIRNQAGYLLGNRQLVRPMTAKNFEAVKKEVDRVVSLAENRDKVCIGTGCLPFETENANGFEDKRIYSVQKRPIKHLNRRPRICRRMKLNKSPQRAKSSKSCT